MRRSLDQKINLLDQRTVVDKSLETLSNFEKPIHQTLVPRNDLEVAFSVSEV